MEALLFGSWGPNRLGTFAEGHPGVLILSAHDRRRRDSKGLLRVLSLATKLLLYIKFSPVIFVNILHKLIKTLTFNYK